MNTQIIITPAGKMRWAKAITQSEISPTSRTASSFLIRANYKDHLKKTKKQRKNPPKGWFFSAKFRKEQE